MTDFKSREGISECKTTGMKHEGEDWYIWLNQNLKSLHIKNYHEWYQVIYDKGKYLEHTQSCVSFVSFLLLRYKH